MQLSLILKRNHLYIKVTSDLSTKVTIDLYIGCFNQPLGKPIIEKCTTSGGRTKEADERSFVFVHQHGGDDVT